MSMQANAVGQPGLSQEMAAAPAENEHELLEIRRISQASLKVSNPRSAARRLDADNDTPKSADQSSPLLSNGGFGRETPSVEIPAAQSFLAGAKHPRGRRIQKLWRNTWVPELLGCGLAGLSLIAIIVTLKMHQGKPLPQWPLNISINALIAIFTVLLKAGLVLPLSEGISQLKWHSARSQPRRLIDMEDFDFASRGAWGSFLFIIRVEGGTLGVSFRDPKTWKHVFRLLKCKKENLFIYLGKFAAFLTVLTFISDPFAQQIVQSVDCSQTSTEWISILSRTTDYLIAGDHLSAGESAIHPPMAVAINTASYSPPERISSLVFAECKSSNCTFKPFQTVGVCHSCNDISGTIQTSDTTPRNWTLVDPSDNETIIWVGQGIMFNTTAAKPEPDTIFRFIAMRNSYQGSENLFGQTAAAFGCRLFPCLREYNSTIKSSVLDETLRSTTPMGANQLVLVRPTRLESFLLGSSRTIRNGTWETCVTSDVAGPGLREVSMANVDAAPNFLGPSFKNETGETKWYPEDCVWGFGRLSETSIRSELSRVLGNLKLEFTPGGAVGLLPAKNLWRGGTMNLDSMNKFMGNLTDIMTATIRKTGNGGLSKYAHGEVSFDSTCLKAQWEWLSFFATLTGLAYVFLTVLLIQSPSNASNRIWKSSSLAVLFCSLDDTVYQSAGAKGTRDEILQSATVLSARLREDVDGKAQFK